MNDYWEQRKHFQYYRTALKLCYDAAFDARSVLDVGCYNTPFLEWLGWIPIKVAIDRLEMAEMPGVQKIRGDFLRWSANLETPFDLVLCLQVLEHLPEPHAFAQGLLAACAEDGVVIVSVPYKWPAGSCVHHCQDPVDIPKLESWFDRSLKVAAVTTDEGMERVVAVFLP